MAEKENSLQIQWYPGHMAKAKRMLEENLKHIDVVAELLDARAPAGTRNPDFDALFARKERLVFLNKSDLADPAVTKAWISHFEARGMGAAALVSTRSREAKATRARIEKAAAPMLERHRAKGVYKTLRVMAVGIPNVGKSSFINLLAGSSRAQVGDRPGVTRGKQWVKLGDYLEIMDTPGLLWPKLEDERHARHLAYIGSVRDEIMDAEALARSLLEELMGRCPDALCMRYKRCRADMEGAALLDAVCESRGFLLPGGIWDRERAAHIVLDEFRAGKIARVSLERPDEAQ